MKKIISLVAALILAVSCMSMLTVSAAGKSTIHFSSNSITVGDTLTVTVKVSADEAMYGVEFALNYDPSVLEFVSGDSCSGGAGVISVAASADSTSRSLTYTFKALKAGSCSISTADLIYIPVSEVAVSVADQGASVTVKDASLSDNANLKSLSISEGSLSPSFSASKTSYTV
ncbi:MAG: cohesin domain-containing protein, partial [Acutalibacteraceae bacterium]|nr:cohesin domain-containing protein [Acutalibacteraceae bacterium]